MKENGKGLGERGGRERRRRAEQGATTGIWGRRRARAGAWGACAAPGEPRLLGRTRGEGRPVRGLQDPGQSHGDRLDRGGGVECGQPRQGGGGEGAVRWAGTQGGRRGVRAGRSQRGQEGQKAGWGQRKDGLSQPRNCSEPQGAALMQLVFIPPKICPWTGDHSYSPNFLWHPLVETCSRPGWRSPSSVSYCLHHVRCCQAKSPQRQGFPSPGCPCKWH